MKEYDVKIKATVFRIVKANSLQESRQLVMEDEFVGKRLLQKAYVSEIEEIKWVKSDL